MEVDTVGSYFTRPKNIEFIHSGCTMLDCVIGGGYPLGRVVNVVGDKSSGKCGKDMYILNQEGLKHLDTQLSNHSLGTTKNAQVLTVTKNNKVKSTHSYKECVGTTYKITTRHGYELECTQDHPILLWKEDCTESMTETKNLKIGDVAVIAKGTNTFGTDSTCDENMAFLLGCIVANGCSPKFKRVEISTTKKYLKLKLEKTILDLGFKPFIKPSNVSIYNKEFAIDIWEKFFNRKENFTARYKFVPTQILESPKHVQINFLRGLIDCDSYCCINDNYLQYYTASETLAKQVHLMLLNLGIVSNRSFDPSAKIGDKVYTHKYWSISIGGKYINRYAEIIGSDKYQFKVSSELETSDFDSIPFLQKKIISDREIIKSTLGWSKNGKLSVDKSRLPKFQTHSLTGITFPYLETFHNLYERFDGVVDMTFYKNILDKGYHYDPISSIEEISYTEGTIVHDVHVPDTHMFWCNGFISHNTLLAIEAFANFNKQYPDGKMFYHEAEAAFDTEYAEALGMPVEDVTFIEDDTVEAFFTNLENIIKEFGESKTHVLYVLDSLDALTDEAEKERNISESTYAMTKQKKMSELFRRLIGAIKHTNICLFIISQVRDNIGVSFGEKFKRSGGKALDFYASQVIWLAEASKLKKTVKGIERPYGLSIKAKCKKNKISLPYRECEFPLLFGYGIDDTTASLAFLNKVKGALEEIGITDIKKVDKADMKDIIRDHVIKVWAETEIPFLPKERKY